MITDKQKQRDYEYEAEYQSKSRYTAEQWTNILKSGQIPEEVLARLKEVYSSFNHAATLLQLSFQEHTPQEEILSCFHDAGQVLGEANQLNPEVDYDGQEYWWYLFFWGKYTEGRMLELKLHPELSEAIGALYPELEEAYYAFMSDVERSLQIRYRQEDAVWIAAAVLLYEKYCQNPEIRADDILLMQYEVQTRSQKVYGQDVNTNTITQVCNADERGHHFNYLRDIYKYYRVSYPGEFEWDRERPDPEEVDYHAYIYSILGYIPLTTVCDFIDHEYKHLMDESYVELTNANGFVRLATFLTRQGGKPFSMEDTSEHALNLRALGDDGTESFHKIGEALCKEYPNFTYAKRGNWYLDKESVINTKLQDILLIDSYVGHHAFIGIQTVTDGDSLHIETSLNLPCIPNEEIMLDIHDKCNMLTLMTAAPFQVNLVPAEPDDLCPGEKIKASVLYRYDEWKAMPEEDILTLFSTSLEIFASYYTDICQNYYPDLSSEERAAHEDGAVPEEEMDPLAKALGSKLSYRPKADVPDPPIIYKEGGYSPTTDSITKALQGYGNINSSQDSALKDDTTSTKREAPPKEESSPSHFVKKESFEEALPSIAPKVPVSVHPDRKEQGFRLYPKNILIKGPMKTGKYHEAIMTAVGIIEGKDPNMMKIEPVPDVLEHFQQYSEEGRILHVACPDIDDLGYAGFIERMRGTAVEDGIFKEFANQCSDGRYVVMMEEVDLDWSHLFGETTVLLRENRREGTSSETAVTLSLSKEKFRLPSNLYLVATCDSLVCETTISEAIDLDFFIHPVLPEPEILHGMRIEGISLQRLMTTLNLRLSYFLGADYQLGEGFFLQSPDKDAFISLSRVFREQLLPLLEKWFDGDMEQIRYVLGDNGKTRSDTIFYLETTWKDTLFKGEIPDSFDKGRRIYHRNEEAFYNPKSYIAIYE